MMKGILRAWNYKNNMERIVSNTSVSQFSEKQPDSSNNNSSLQQQH